MLDFMRWGDSQMILAARSVNDEGYYREQGMSLGSIHKLMVHAMAAQWIWLCRWRGETPDRIETSDDYPTRQALEQHWPLVHAAMFDFFGLQSSRGLEKIVEYRNTRGEVFAVPLYELILHVVDHATYHRGQLNSMIKRAGGTPVTVGYQQYVIQKARHP
jgi:uncharacterized damage-inducible protein DinB